MEVRRRRKAGAVAQPLARRLAQVVGLGLATGVLTAVPLATGSTATAAPLLATAGDIACDPKHRNFNHGKGRRGQCRQLATSRLLKGADKVLALGDNQYEHGSLRNFRRSYDRSWGRYLRITRSVIGNHEYGPPSRPNLGARGYWDYFGKRRAGPRGRGWYSFDLGAWHIIVLNSHCRASSKPTHMQPKVGCGRRSRQGRWLRRDLAASQDKRCILAAWHHPRFSSRGGFTELRPFWRLLQRAGADVVLSGHNHMYERFSPRRTNGSPAQGAPRQFVVGTGGKSIAPRARKRDRHSEKLVRAYGVLRLRLRDGAYRWRFMRAGNRRVLDSGSASCGER